MPFKIDLRSVEKIGRDLVRPEGVMALKDGTVWTSHGEGHCTCINPDGTQKVVGELGGEPNGICIDRDGSVIVANIGNGKLQRLRANGSSELIADKIEGRPIPTPNFPLVDSRGNLWCTNSTMMRRHFDATRNPVPDGSLFRIENGRSRILVEGILFANGCALDAEEKFIYIAETMGKCVLRYEVLDNGEVGRPEQYGPSFGPEGHPDGIAFDAAGNLWITLVVMNGLGVITPDRKFHVVLHDTKADLVRRPTNITFGGPDLRTAYLGSLRGPYLATFRAPEPGLPLIHQK